MALNQQAQNVHLTTQVLAAHFRGESAARLVTDQDDVAAVAAGSRTLADAMTARLAGLRRSSFNRTLDELPPSDVGYPGPPDRAVDWSSAIDQLKQGDCRPSLNDRCPTVARSLLSVAAALIEACGAELGQPPTAMADLLTRAAPHSLS